MAGKVKISDFSDKVVLVLSNSNGISKKALRHIVRILEEFLDYIDDKTSGYPYK